MTFSSWLSYKQFIGKSNSLPGSYRLDIMPIIPISFPSHTISLILNQVFLMPYPKVAKNDAGRNIELDAPERHRRAKQ